MLSTATAQNTPALPNDPFKVKIFTLKNGLKVFISPNKELPRVQTMIAVKAGSKYDPATTTGLAHYLEHMMFKGTHKYGTLDWAKEKEILDKISAKYEEHLKETDPEKKKAIYKEIDQLSYEASKWAVPSEYDKMVGSIGASGTNAFTSNDMTVYVNDIPSNAIDKWAKLEAERFSTLVLRLFHTELETVYEEFNRNQDDDIRWSYAAVDSILMPNHPYGTQTTIGRGEHLKNPSMVNIHNYFNTYYVPNNVAIILCGDVDEKTVLPILEKQFGNWQTKQVPAFVKAPPVPLNSVQKTEVKGPTKEHVIIGYRFDGDGTKQAMMARMIDMLLNNGTAGILDLNLIQKQKVLAANSAAQAMKDYTTFSLYGEPKQGQTLEEVETLLLQQLSSIKKGEFDEWLLPAVIQNLKLQQMKYTTNNRSRAYLLMDAFVKDIDWKIKVNELDEMAKITKKDIVDFANTYFKENYAVCYKRLGEPNRHKVEKPTITPVVLNKDSSSSFKTAFDAMSLASLQPKFVDYEKDITKYKAPSGTEVLFVQNTQSKLFSLAFEFNQGTYNNKKLQVISDYINFLGTSSLTPDQVKQEFYKLGISSNTGATRDKFYISISGLEENLDKATKLWGTVLATLKSDETIWQTYVEDVLKKRKNAKLNKNVILSAALVNYAKYGENNPFKFVLSEDELKKQDPDELLDILKKMLPYPDRIKYYGSKAGFEKIKTQSNTIAAQPAATTAASAVSFSEKNIEKPIIYFCNYNMKQAEIILLNKNENFNKNILTAATLYNDYYGAGLSSILFQEIREKMGLAYAVSSRFSVPAYNTEAHYLTAYVGTQSDKMKTALTELHGLLTNFVFVPKQFEGVKSAAIKNIESDWLTEESYFASYENAKKRGLSTDINKTIYEELKNFKKEDLEKFFNEKIKNKPFAYCIIGNKENIDFDYLNSLGEVKTLTLEEIFGY